MDINTFDLLLLFILAIVVSLIIGMNVIYIVDKKMSDITINIPPAVCPTPNVYIRSENGVVTKANIDVDPKVDNSNNTDNKNRVNYKVPIQLLTKDATVNNSTMNRRINSDDSFVPNSSNTNNNKKIEGFHNVQKSNENGNSYHSRMPIPSLLTVDTGKETEKVVLKQGYNTPVGNTPNAGNDIVYPNADDIVRYNGPGCYQNISSRGVRRINTTNQNQPICNSTMKIDAVNTVQGKIMMADGTIVDNNASIFVPPTYMGGYPNIKGYNFGQTVLQTQADVDQIGSIPTNDYTGQPMPAGTNFISN